MKILFCSTTPLTKTLGASKVIVELGEQLELLGWQVDFVTPFDLLPNFSSLKRIQFQQLYSQKLKDYITEHGHLYDVIDYDHACLPYARSLFYPSTLMVARSVLLAHHFTVELAKSILNKPKPNFKSKTFFFIKKILGIDHRMYKELEQIRIMATLTCLEADIVNVSNNYDYDELTKHGIPRDKIVVLPFGMTTSRYNSFFQNSSALDVPSTPRIAFVGTFDYRKGASDFPKIVKLTSQFIPKITFRLIGTKGLFNSEQEVLNMFFEEHRSQIEVISKFEPDDLPKLLQDCSLGIFPSYVEGFGFGVLEMLAAGLPVIAYDAPGPPMMLPPEYLVAPADINRMVEKVVDLLKDQNKLVKARLWAKKRAKDFKWEDIAKKTSNMYIKKWQELKSNH